MVLTWLWLMSRLITGGSSFSSNARRESRLNIDSPGLRGIPSI